MGTLALIKSALEAISALPKLLDGIGELLKTNKLESLEREYREKLDDITEFSNQIKKANSDEDLRQILRNRHTGTN